jgi:hypothetical protein
MTRHRLSRPQVPLEDAELAYFDVKSATRKARIAYRHCEQQSLRLFASGLEVFADSIEIHLASLWFVDTLLTMQGWTIWHSQT